MCRCNSNVTTACFLFPADWYYSLDNNPIVWTRDYCFIYRFEVFEKIRKHFCTVLGEIQRWDFS